MAIVKKKQLKSLSVEELKAKLAEITAELSRERSAATRAKNTAKVKELRKLASRILNFLHAKSVTA